MKQLIQRMGREDAGVLTFEWILLVTVLVIGIVGGLSATRDAVVTELGDVVEAMISLDQSYTISHPWDVQSPDCGVDGASDSAYTDAAGMEQGRAPQRFRQNQCCISDCGVYVERPFR